MAKKRVLGVVGMGHVGAHVAYALAIQGIADELVLVDQNEQKLASEVQDLRDAVAYMPHRVTVRGGDFSDLGVCDVIVNSVGKIDLLRGTHDRVTEMDFTIPAVRGYAEKIKASGFDGVLINITNPCDIVTRELALHLGLPRGRVFGNPETTTGGNALKFYASVRVDVRRTTQIKDGDEALGNRTKVKIVKNKMAPPFKKAEFDIVFGEGISHAGEVIDLGVELDIIKKSGSWFSYGDTKLAQGREAVKQLLSDNVELCDEIEAKIRAALAEMKD